jgi:hypothetical protein
LCENGTFCFEVLCSEKGPRLVHSKGEVVALLDMDCRFAGVQYAHDGTTYYRQRISDYEERNVGGLISQKEGILHRGVSTVKRIK